MREVTVTEREAGQRLDRYLAKYLGHAGKGFVQKMLRKKNITLNGKRAEGAERVRGGDVVRLFLSDETIRKFQGEDGLAAWEGAPGELSVLYEDDDVLIVNKPVGMLSQKARPEDLTLVELVTGYLLGSGALTREEARGFRPGVCNRLDRNTSGAIVAGKSQEGLRAMGELFRERRIGKLYWCVVRGDVARAGAEDAFLRKDGSHNKVTVSQDPIEGGEPIRTEYVPLRRNGEHTLLEVRLVTGRPHQIRAHMQSLGHPVVGDGKYGDVSVNREFRKRFGLRHQLLHCRELDFPPMPERFSGLSGRKAVAPIPDDFRAILLALFGEGDADGREAGRREEPGIAGKNRLGRGWREESRLDQEGLAEKT